MDMQNEVDKCLKIKKKKGRKKEKKKANWCVSVVAL
jgi:uncharacterized protein Veg